MQVKMEKVKDAQNIMSAAQTGAGLIKQIEEVLNIFRPYKPEIRRFRINYQDRSSEIKYLLQIPPGMGRRTHRKVQLPATTGFRIDEVMDLDTTDILGISYDSEGKMWIFNTGDFPESSRFMVTLKGMVSPDFLNRLVSVNCAANPRKEEDCDCYWIHSALKDVSILEHIWNELDIERVDVGVRIGVERFFSSTIPHAVKERLQTQSKLLTAIERGERNIERLKMDYRRSVKGSKISPTDLVDLMMKLVSGEFFADFVKLDNPFFLGSIEPYRGLTSIIPERVNISVLSYLNFRSPAAKGELTFNRKKYVNAITENVNEFVPSKK